MKHQRQRSHDPRFDEPRQWEWREDDYRFRSGGLGAVPPPQQRRIDPKGYVRTDQRIRENVCEALSLSGIDVSDVEVQVHDGHVTLSGSVSDRWMKYRIEDIADDCGGVKDISNHLGIAWAAGGGRETAGNPRPEAGMSGTLGKGVSGSGEASASPRGETMGSGQVQRDPNRSSS